MAVTQMFKAPIVRVALADTRRRRYDINAGDEPFFVYDRLPDLAKQGKLYYTYFPANTLLQFGAQQVPHIISINRKHLKGVMPRPIYRQPLPWARADGTPTRRWGVVTSPGGEEWAGGGPIGTVHNDFWDYYTFLPTAGANWDFNLAEDGLLWELTQKVAYTGTGENLSDWIVSVMGFAGTQNEYNINQGLCPNPFFTAGFRRQGIPPEFTAAWGGGTDGEWTFEEAMAALALGANYILRACTQIVWGVNPEIFPDGRWMLHCPLQGKPMLYERVLAGHPWVADPESARWEPRVWTEGDLSEITPKKAAEDGYTYHIGCMGHAICVSEGSFDGEGNFAYYLTGNMNEPVVPYGEMFIRNWPGQCTFWLDLNVFPTAKLQRWPFAVPAFRAADVGSYLWGQPFSSVYQNATDPVDSAVVVSELPGIEGMAAELLPLGLYEDMATQGLLRYDLLLSAGSYPVGADPQAEVVTQTPPFVEAVTLFQNPQLTDNGATTFTETDRGVVSLRAEEDLEELSAAHHELVLTNGMESFTVPTDELGEPEEEPEGGWCATRDFTPGRQLQLQSVGWRMKNLDGSADSDSVVSMGNYFIVGPRRRSRQALFDVTDLLGMVALAKWDGETDLNFRGWNASEAIAFGLEYNGIGTDQYDLEDTGLVVPDDRDHCYERGTSWLKILRSLVDAGGTLYYDWSNGKVKSGCRYCRGARTAGTLLTHADNAWASSACLAVDAARIAGGVDFLAVDTPEPSDDGSLVPYEMYPADGFECEEATLDPRDFANQIVVVGKYSQRTWARSGMHWPNMDGWDDIVGRWRNTASLDWNELTPDDDYLGWIISHIENDDSLQTEQQVWQRVAELAASMSTRAKKCRFWVPLLPTLRAGMVTKIQGAKYAQCHDLKFRITSVRHDPKTSLTQVRGRQMMGLPAV